MFELSLAKDRWPLRVPFRTATSCDIDTETLTVTMTWDGVTGRGEASGVHYHGETADSMAAQIDAVRDFLSADLTFDAVSALLPPGGARNALDCALWDWTARAENRPVWALAGLTRPQPVRTTVTIGADTPEVMAVQARQWSAFGAVKIKLLGDDGDAERVRAVRAARPDAWLAVDGNQGFNVRSLGALMPTLVNAKVVLIEQPLPIGDDHLLNSFDVPIPFAADESIQTAQDLAALAAAYTVINIKLDKTGGLTGALDLAARARAEGREVMVGNMVGTSLAMAPAWLAGQGSNVVDLDGPLLLARDRASAARYDDGQIECPSELWGGGR
ncbi:MAG: dipeptide epimerase [Sphingomonas sp.]